MSENFVWIRKYHKRYIMYFSCGTFVAKYILFFFNAVVFVIGGGLLGLGGWVALRRGFIYTFFRVLNIHVSPAVYAAVLDKVPQTLLCAGAVAFVLGFLGCWGTLRESTPLLYLYGLSLIAALGLQVAAGAYGVVLHRQHLSNLSAILTNSLEIHYTVEDKDDPHSRNWDEVMKVNGCCGVFNFTDFTAARNWQREKIPAAVVPTACCHLSADDEGEFQLLDTECPFNPSTTNSNYLNGCIGILKTYFLFPAPVAAPILIGIGLFQVFSIILTLCLCCELDAIKVEKSQAQIWNTEVFFRDKYARACPPYSISFDDTIVCR